MEIEIDSNIYRIGKLNAKQQFHLMRRITPILISYADIDSSNNLEKSLKQTLMAMKPIMDAIAAMSDSDSEYVIDLCLSACEIQDGSRFQKISVNGSMLYSHIDMTTMMKLVKEVISENLGNFLNALA
jgi:hypothetical protein